VYPVDAHIDAHKPVHGEITKPMNVPVYIWKFLEYFETENRPDASDLQLEGFKPECRIYVFHIK
jgi:hypothetical protein